MLSRFHGIERERPPFCRGCGVAFPAGTDLDERMCARCLAGPYQHPSGHSHHLATGPDVAGAAARAEADDENELRAADCLEREEPDYLPDCGTDGPGTHQPWCRHGKR